MKVKMMYARSGGIGVVGNAYVRYLPQFGVEWVDKNYDLLVGHAGILGDKSQVEHNHGLWWTADMPNAKVNHWRGNAKVIQSLRAARIVTVPTRWVKINIARNMHINPVVIPHGVEWDEWQSHAKHERFVLWNKGRAGDVCSVEPLQRLALKSPGQPFVSTFGGDRIQNIQTVGRLPFDKMKPIIQRAQVYLSTTKETFGIGTLEAMASGVPILGYDWGGTRDLVTHKETGFLVRPGDIDGLVRGLNYCIANRKRLGDAAREAAKEYTWIRVAAMVAEIYEMALRPVDPGVTIVIPVYNYAGVLPRAIKSCLNQTLLPSKIIVVDDGSDDENAVKRVVNSFGDSEIEIDYVRQENAGVAHARNTGVRRATTELICCLDPDDQVAPGFLKCTVPQFKDPLLGVAYTGMVLLSQDGTKTKETKWPPSCNFDRQIEGRNQVPTCSVIRRRAWLEMGGQRQRYAPGGCGTEDAAGYLSIGANGWRMKRVTDKPLFIYTVGGYTWDKQNYQKTDWTGWHSFTRDRKHPFASIATPAGHSTHPVEQLDIPDVSVIIPVGPAHTKIMVDALDSLEAQTLRRWEAIVVNDSGTELDLTAWPYVTLVETDGAKGAGYARNRGIEVAQSEQIVCLDADDFLQFDALELFLEARKDHPDAWIYPDMYIYKSGKGLENYSWLDFSVEELYRRGVAPVTCLYTKGMWRKAGGFDENSNREDWDFHLRLAKAGFCGIRLPATLLTYRHGTGTRRRSSDAKVDAERIRKRYNLEELMASCGSCKKRRANVKRSPPPAPPKNWMPRDEADGASVQMEFVGENKNDLVFKGPSGRRYIAGNNPHHRIVRMSAADVEWAERMRYFRRREPQRVMAAQSQPGSTSRKSKKPKSEKKIDIGNVTLKQLKALDLTGANLNRLMEIEAEGKNRSTVLRYLRAEKRRRQTRGKNDRKD